MADRVGKAFVIHGLGDVDVAAQLVAAFDFVLVVRGCQYDNRRAFDVTVYLDPLEDIDPGHVGQIQVEQNQKRLILMIDA